MMLPNDIINNINDLLNTEDSVHLASTCKLWMKWFRDQRIINTTFIPLCTGEYLPFFCPNAKLVLDRDSLFPPLPPYKVSSDIKYLSNRTTLHFDANGLPDESTYNNVFIFNEWLKLLPNLKKLSLNWNKKYDNERDHLELIDNTKAHDIVIPDIIIPSNVDILKMGNNEPGSTILLSYIIPLLYISDINDGSDESLSIIFKGTKFINHCRNDRTIVLNSSKVRYVKTDQNILLAERTVKNIVSINCSRINAMSSKLCRFEQLTNITIHDYANNSDYFSPSNSRPSNLYRCLYVDNIFPKLEILNLKVNIVCINRLKNLSNLKVLSLIGTKVKTNEIELFKLNNPNIWINIK